MNISNSDLQGICDQIPISYDSVSSTWHGFDCLAVWLPTMGDLMLLGIAIVQNVTNDELLDAMTLGLTRFEHDNNGYWVIWPDIQAPDWQYARVG